MALRKHQSQMKSLQNTVDRKSDHSYSSIFYTNFDSYTGSDVADSDVDNEQSTISLKSPEEDQMYAPGNVIPATSLSDMYEDFKNAIDANAAILEKRPELFKLFNNDNIFDHNAFDDPYDCVMDNLIDHDVVDDKELPTDVLHILQNHSSNNVQNTGHPTINETTIPPAQQDEVPVVDCPKLSLTDLQYMNGEHNRNFWMHQHNEPHGAARWLTYTDNKNDELKPANYTIQNDQEQKKASKEIIDSKTSCRNHLRMIPT